MILFVSTGALNGNALMVPSTVVFCDVSFLGSARVHVFLDCISVPLKRIVVLCMGVRWWFFHLSFSFCVFHMHVSGIKKNGCMPFLQQRKVQFCPVST